jgi:hypothetical protein
MNFLDVGESTQFYDAKRLKTGKAVYRSRQYINILFIYRVEIILDFKS